MRRLIYRDGEWKEVNDPNPRKIYCDSEHCPVSDNCFRHFTNLVIERPETLICEEFDRDGECMSYDPIEDI